MAQPQSRQILLTAALVLAIVGIFFFGYRAGRHARHIRRENEPVRAWMSVPFIAHSHHVSPDILFKAAGVQQHEQHDRRSLRRIAREEKRPVDDVIRDVEKAIASARKGP